MDRDVRCLGDETRWSASTNLRVSKPDVARNKEIALMHTRHW
jgi:hypothetical protein